MMQIEYWTEDMFSTSEELDQKVRGKELTGIDSLPALIQVYNSFHLKYLLNF